MKIRNKLTPNKLGKIVPYDAGKDGGIAVKTDQGIVWYYHSLAELNEEWEDYEEPKEYWFINDLDGEPMKCELRYCSARDFADWVEKRKKIGNYFETEEEAEKAVEKLKAWKRLKDKGFRLNAVVDTFFCLDIFMKGEPYEAIKDDLKIVFGGENK